MKSCTYRLNIAFLFCVATADAFAQQRGQQASYYFELGEKAYSQGRFREALSRFNECLVLDAGYMEAYTSRAATKERLDDWAGAVTDYSIFLETHPQHRETIFSRGLARYKAKQFEQAIDDFNKLLTLPGDDQETHSIFYRQSPFGGGTSQIITMQGSIRDYILNYVGLAELELKHFEKAIIYFDSAIYINSTDADYYVHRGLANERAGNYSKAEDNYHKALELNEDHALALHNLGVLEALRGNMSRAEQQLTRSIERNPHLPYPYLERGYYRMTNGDLAGALSDYNKGISIDRSDAENWLNRGLVKEKLGDHKGAYQDYSTAIELRQDFEKAWMCRGNILGKQGKLDEAIEDYTVAILYYPEYAEAYYNRAVIRYRMKNFSDACADLELAIRYGMKVPNKMKHSMCNRQQ